MECIIPGCGYLDNEVTGFYLTRANYPLNRGPIDNFICNACLCSAVQGIQFGISPLIRNIIERKVKEALDGE